MGGTALSLTALEGMPEVGRGDDLSTLIADALDANGVVLADQDVIVVCQKIVSKAEGRLVDLATVEPSAKAQDLARQVDKDPRLVELILQESNTVLRAVPGVLIVRHRLGFVMANAGVDQSNVPGGEGHALLLPSDPDRAAQDLRAAIRSRLGVDVAILINDSFGRAWRLGTCGICIGAAGLTALLDLKGTPDRAGRRLQVTEVAIADELAAAASLVMGQASESRPVVVVKGLDPAFFVRAGCAAELIRSIEGDLFR